MRAMILFTIGCCFAPLGVADPADPDMLQQQIDVKNTWYDDDDDAQFIFSSSGNRAAGGIAWRRCPYSGLSWGCPYGQTCAGEGPETAQGLYLCCENRKIKHARGYALCSNRSRDSSCYDSVQCVSNQKLGCVGGWCTRVLQEGEACDRDYDCKAAGDAIHCIEGKCAKKQVVPQEQLDYFSKSGIIIPPLNVNLFRKLLYALKVATGMAMVPACENDDIQPILRSEKNPRNGAPKNFVCEKYGTTRCGGKCRRACPPDKPKMCSDCNCINENSTSCSKLTEAKVLAVFELVMNFLPGIGQIKKMASAVSMAQHANRAATKAVRLRAIRRAARTAVREFAKEKRDELMWAAVESTAKYFIVKGLGIKKKYLEAMLDGDEGSVVSEGLISGGAEKEKGNSVGDEIVTFMKDIDPTGIAATVSAFNKPGCSGLKPTGLTLAQAFDVMPMCMLVGYSDCVAYTTTGY